MSTELNNYFNDVQHLTLTTLTTLTTFDVYNHFNVPCYYLSQEISKKNKDLEKDLFQINSVPCININLYFIFILLKIKHFNDYY